MTGDMKESGIAVLLLRRKIRGKLMKNDIIYSKQETKGE